MSNQIIFLNALSAANRNINKGLTPLQIMILIIAVLITFWLYYDLGKKFDHKHHFGN